MGTFPFFVLPLFSLYRSKKAEMLQKNHIFLPFIRFEQDIPCQNCFWKSIGSAADCPLETKVIADPTHQDA
jgi:hypothetical protein